MQLVNFFLWLGPKQLQHILIPNSWVVENRRQKPNRVCHSWCQLMPSQVCTRSPTCICLINHSVRHLRCWVGVNQARLGTSMLPWAAHGDGKDFSAEERRMLIYLLAESSSLCPPFPISWSRLRNKRLLLTAFWAAFVAKKVSVIVFCSSRISDAVLYLLVTTKNKAMPAAWCFWGALW